MIYGTHTRIQGYKDTRIQGPTTLAGILYSVEFVLVSEKQSDLRQFTAIYGTLPFFIVSLPKTYGNDERRPNVLASRRSPDQRGILFDGIGFWTATATATAATAATAAAASYAENVGALGRDTVRFDRTAGTGGGRQWIFPGSPPVVRETLVDQQSQLD
jgi:hypothetical protein